MSLCRSREYSVQVITECWIVSLSPLVWLVYFKCSSVQDGNWFRHHHKEYNGGQSILTVVLYKYLSVLMASKSFNVSRINFRLSCVFYNEFAISVKLLGSKLSANFGGKLAAHNKSINFVSQKSVLLQSPELEVTEIILAKVSRLCQLSSHSPGFLCNRFLNP